MILNEMIDLQKILDYKILSERELDSQETMPDRLLALYVEIGECANEWRGFKYWSDDQEARRPKMLEEYVDNTHFIVSVGNHYGYIESDKNYEPTPFHENISVTNQFLDIFLCLTELISYPRKEVFEELLLRFLALGKMVNFSENQILAAYRKKNEVNHTRQETNY